MRSEHRLPAPTVTAALTPQDAEAVRALAAAARAADGVEALGEQTLLDLTAPSSAVRHLLVRPPTHTQPVHDRTAPLLGYAALTAEGGAELVVDPRHRRHGIGTALLEAVRTTAATAGFGSPVVWAHGDLPAARALATRAGMVAVRELWQMAADLPAGIPLGTTPPDGVVVRPFVVGQDEQSWLAVNARAFAHHPEQGRMTLADLQAREQEPWFDPADLLLAERDGVLLASVWMKVEPGGDTGELYVLGVDPGAQGQGLGRLLTALTLTHLADRGLRHVVLFTEADNRAAVRTYRAAGFGPSRVDVQYR